MSRKPGELYTLVGIGLGDVLHVGADKDQTAGAALAFADRDPGTDAGLRSFEFGLLLPQFLHESPLVPLIHPLEAIELFLVVRGHGYGIMRGINDRVRAAEAKYAAMAGTAEKLEATLKKLKGTAQTCQWSIDQLHRSVEKDKASDRAGIVMFVLMP